MPEIEKNRPKRQKTGGRRPGSPNKVTADARAAIALFVDGNAHRLTEWLDAVADGDPESDIRPNPAKAFELFQSVVEYHVPKLARTEHTGGLTLKRDAADLTDAELAEIATRHSAEPKP